MTNAIKIKGTEYTIDLENIEKYIYKDNDNNLSEKEITDIYQYGIEDEEKSDTAKTLNTKQIRELKVTNVNQISTFRYDIIRMLIENIQYIQIANNSNEVTYNGAISFNTLLNYNFIKKVK
jgi:hypothetical protein